MSRDKKVIIIGAGLGGISAAISLATEGFEVELYEKNDKIGGKLNILKKNGFSFDLGPSISTLPHIFEGLFTKAGRRMDDYLELEEIKLQWRSFFEDGTMIDLYADIEKNLAQNSNLNKEDIRELDKFLVYSKKLSDLATKGYFDQGIDSFREVITCYGLFNAIIKFDFFSTMHQGVSRYLSNKYLQQIMDFFIKYVGSSPYNAPAVLNLLPNIQMEYGLWYVKGGMYNLAKGLERLLKELGVKIYLNTEVREVVKEGDELIAIRLADDSLVKSDIFISNMEVIPAYKELLAEEDGLVDKYEKKFEPACSGLVLHLGLDCEYEELAHHNFFFSKDPKDHFNSVFNKYELPKDPTIYLVASSKTDKSQAPKGCENIKVLPHIPYLQDQAFTYEDYLELKELVLDKLERMGLKDLREHIVVEDMWTPEDIKTRYYSNRGSIYGVVADRKKNKGFKAPKHSELYRNLYFVGGSVNPGGGMPMVTLSGQQVRDKIIKEY
ncbi:phytoene desaturase family protein [Orenia marismortui]|uniref:phytoene desaturase family protein n=1 Tax=Orenia marismortui TaxID=46469 RepID=UPI000374665C|nr:phytoene desaturase family protein [Orenia marismortui]